MKDPLLHDDPPNPDWRPGMADVTRVLRVNSCDHPDVIGVAVDLRRVCDEFADRVLIGELYRPVDRLVAFYGPKLDGVQLPFNFHLIDADWHPAAIADLVGHYEAALPPGAWPNWVLGNHDQSRVATRLGPAKAPLAMMLLLTLRGTPTIYQGDELGLEDAMIPQDRIRDPWALNEPGIGGRDPERSPMPWDASRHAGFTTGEPWLPLAEGWETRNVAHEEGDTRSLLQLTRQLLAMRREQRALSVGDYRLRMAEGDLYAFERRAGDDSLVVLLNFGAGLVTLPPWAHGEVLLSTHRVAVAVAGSLLPYEGIVIAG